MVRTFDEYFIQITKESKDFKRTPNLKEKVKNEIITISKDLNSGEKALSRSYGYHLVGVKTKNYEGTCYAADAKRLNEVNHQYGRGCWRHLFEKDNYKVIGLAKEIDQSKNNRSRYDLRISPEKVSYL